MPFTPANFNRMNEDGSPIFIAQTNKNFNISTQNFTQAELEALGARRGDYVIALYYANADISGMSIGSSSNQTWTSPTVAGGGNTAPAQIAVRRFFAVFNGTWSGTFGFSNTVTSDAQGCGIVVYRFSDQTKTLTSTTGLQAASGTSGTNVYQATAATDVSLDKAAYLSQASSANNKTSILSVLIAAAGSNSLTTPITLNITTNDGWNQDAQWTYANSGYTIVRVYTIMRQSQWASSASIPTMQFDRTNGSGHVLWAMTVYSDA